MDLADARLARTEEREKKRRRTECTENIDPSDIPEVGNTEEISGGFIEEAVTEPVNPPPTSPQTTASQCLLLTESTERWGIEMFENDNKSIQFYTGFENLKHFNLVFDLLGPAAYELKNRCEKISPKNQFFMTMMKIRQVKEDFELSLFFKVSETLVSSICTTWINFMYYQFKEIPLWPSKDTVQQHMPAGFNALFPTTRVILDATETPISKPSNVNAQSETYSSYKNRNTLKTMIGITPMGAVSHISSSYGGSASDRQIIERPELVEPGKFEKKDSIMADRGIMVQDIFASKDVFVNTPTMLKGKAQLDAETVVRDRRISSKWIHVERVIGMPDVLKF